MESTLHLVLRLRGTRSLIFILVCPYRTQTLLSFSTQHSFRPTLINISSNMLHVVPIFWTMQSILSASVVLNINFLFFLISHKSRRLPDHNFPSLHHHSSTQVFIPSFSLVCLSVVFYSLLLYSCFLSILPQDGLTEADFRGSYIVV